ncbi:MAG: TolB-like 6-bladed beta-propeller domain-containing protein [Clostridium sp.]|nr:TolB-like 6-bladed beta-propeller domain-containing protein [Bacteroides sp.]MCM1199014.1 TolB-like 6-bladed beta-propeller domain-containing protein [Clostridium sp.]
MKRLLILALGFMSIACTSQTTGIEPMTTIDDYGIVKEFPFETFGTISDMIVCNGQIVALSMNSENLFHVIEPENGNILCQWGKRGRGPNEYLNIANQLSCRDSLLYFADNIDKCIYELNLRKIVETGEIDMERFTYPYTSDFRQNKFIRCHDDCFACLGAIADMRLGIIDRKGRILGHDVGYPEIDNRITGIFPGSVFQSLMRPQPNGSRFVVSLLSSDFFEIFELCGQEVHVVYRKEDSHMPKTHYKPKNGVNYTIDYDNSIAGILNIATTEDSIFFLYSGKTYSEVADAGNESDIILRFSWSGELMDRYKLPLAVSRIAARGETIYAIRHLDDSTCLYRMSI